MVKIIDAKHATIRGTPQQVYEFLRLLRSGPAIIDLKFARIEIQEGAADVTSGPKATGAKK